MESIKKYENDTFIIHDEIEGYLDMTMLHLLEGSVYNLYKSNVVISTVINKDGYLFEKKSGKEFYLQSYYDDEKNKLIENIYSFLV